MNCLLGLSAPCQRLHQSVPGQTLVTARDIARPCRTSELRRDRLDHAKPLRVCAQKSDETKPDPVSELLPENACPTCGADLAKAPRGCDREGRIAGGLGAVLGFDWWPIKAYKPCPELAKGGYSYIRKGQITDAILFPKQQRRDQ